MTQKYILSLDNASLKDTALLGGKGANLAELVSAGFPVPPGFGITSPAYLDFLSVNQLDETIDAMAAEIDFENPEHIEAVTTEIRKLIVDATVPTDMETEIKQAYEAMGSDLSVAVRSSSAVPDLGVSSFPGQMDTFYHVAGLQDLLRHLKLCWGSFWTARAAASRWSQGIHDSAVRIGVVIQEMVPSEASGVVFTANPITLEKELVVEAIPGLGDALVSGRVTPDRFVLSGEPIAFKEKPEQSKVAIEIIETVAEMSLRIHKYYGHPQDIEWAYANQQLFILQSRNVRIKSAKSLDYSGLERWNKPLDLQQEEITWTRAWSDEVLTRAITPLFYSLQGELISKTYDFIYACYGYKQLASMRILQFHKNRAYFSTHYLMECLRYVPQGSRDDEALKFFTPEQKDQARSLPFRLGGKLLSELRLLLLHRKYTFTRCYKTYYEEWLPVLLRRVKELDQLDLATASMNELQDYSRGMDELLIEHCRPIGLGVMVHTAMAVTLLRKLLEDWFGDGDIVGSLLSGLPGNRTVEANEAAWKLAKKIGKSPAISDLFHQYDTAEITTRLGSHEEGRKLVQACDKFRQEYGFRGAEDREISFPRWGDDPELLINILKAFVQAGDRAGPEESEQSAIKRREDATEKVLKTLSKKPWGLVKRRIFQFLLDHAQVYSLFRENQRYDADRVFYGERKAFLAIAEQLVRSRTLVAVDDIWFLSKEEVFDVIAGKIDRIKIQQTIAPRKAEYRRFTRTTPPMFLLGDKEQDLAPLEADPEGDVVITGVAASPGKVTGRARVVFSLRELSRIEPGDILVTNATDPGWTPVFLLIQGLVLETGGILAHGTVLSREYGLPAVTSLRNATSRIKDGEMITIDGSRGTVHLGLEDEK